MAEYIKRAVAVKAVLRERKPTNSVAQNRMLSIIQRDLLTMPAADVAPIEALERLRDELYEQDLITMEGLRKLNTLIGKYTTVHDGGTDHEAD